MPVVNDSWGGKAFTGPFGVGDMVGLRMAFTRPNYHQFSSGQRKCKVNVFFTRNGRKDGEWDLHEQVDADTGSVKKLEGDFDLFGAIGLSSGVDFEACFDRDGWL